MKFFQASLLSVAFIDMKGMSAAASAPADDSYCLPRAVSTWEQESIFSTFVNEFYVNKAVSNAIHTYVAESYIQHNPIIAQGPAATIAYLSTILPSLNFTILRLAMDNGLGWVHVRVDGLGPLPTAIVDIYRFNGSCVQEHWDVIEAVPANATNPLALF